MNENEVRKYWDNPHNLAAQDKLVLYYRWLMKLGLKETANIIWTRHWT